MMKTYACMITSCVTVTVFHADVGPCIVVSKLPNIKKSAPKQN